MYYAFNIFSQQSQLLRAATQTLRDGTQAAAVNNVIPTKSACNWRGKSCEVAVDALGQLYQETTLQQGVFLGERTVHQDVAKGSA